MHKSIPASLLALSAIASAQAGDTATKEEAPNSNLQEVVVTASLTPVQLQQTGNAVHVISSDDIERSHAAMVSDLLRDVPGVAINRGGVLGSTTQLRMRGSEGNHVLVLVDGMEVNDGSQGDEFNWAHMPTAGIERIEVVSGAQSVMWGSNAVGGVINIITRQAASGSQGDVFTEVGSHGTSNSGFSLGGRTETAHLSLRASHLASDGENISRHGGEEDGYRNTTVNLNAGWRPIENLSFSLSGRQTEGENEFDAGDPPSDANNESEIRQRFVRAQADLSLLDDRWQHRVAVAVSRHGNENFTDGLLTGSSRSRKKQYSYLTSYAWDEQKQRLSLLVERETETFSQRGPVFWWGDPNQNRDRETNAVALEYRVVLWEDLTLGASLRHDDNTEFDDAYTRRFDASYLIAETGTRLRATWGTAVKNPTFSERYGYFTSFVGNPDLRPEKSTSWDVGVDQSLFNERLQLGLTYFKARLENEIDGFVYDPTIPPFGAYTAENVSGTSYREGVELTARAALSPTVTLKGSYTYTDATEPDGSGRDVDEHRRPHNLGSATLQWDPSSKWSLALNAQYNGHQDDSDFSLYPAPVVRLDSYTLLNLSASFHATNQLTVYGRFENILDDDYEEVFGYQSLGFGAMVGVRYSFAR
ncbi:MAG: TonB-dependent receptor [Porticoccaceae bacterium]